jgi:hypothetical protein
MTLTIGINQFGMLDLMLVIVLIRTIVMDNVVIYGYYDYDIYITGGKYHGAIWISSHVVMSNRKCGLRLERELLM